MPDSKIEIVGNCFAGCEYLFDDNGFIIRNGHLIRYAGKEEKAVVPEGVTSIGRTAFSDCNSLKTISIPDSIQSIDDYAFGESTSVKRVEISYDLLEKLNFFGQSVEVCLRKKDGSVQKVICCYSNRQHIAPVSKNTIENYDSLVVGKKYEDFKMAKDVRFKAAIYRLVDKELPVSDETKKLFAEMLKENIAKAVKFAISEQEPDYIKALCDVKAIDSENIGAVKKAVSSCRIPEIQSLIEKRIKEIESGSDEGSDTVIPDDASDFVIENDVLKKYVGGKRIVTVPDCIKVCENYSFSDRNLITQIILPDGLEKIGNYAFDGCYNLSKINIPNSVKSVGCYIFAGCISLKCIELSESLLPDVPLSIWQYKTIDMILHRTDGSVIKTLCCVSYDGHIAPINKEDARLFDTIIAMGSASGYKMTLTERIKSALFRLVDTVNPVEHEFYESFKKLLEDNLSKAIKCAEDEVEPRYIQAMVNIRAIRKRNLGKVKNALSASKIPDIRSAWDSLVVKSNTSISEDEELSEVEQLVTRILFTKSKQPGPILKDFYDLSIFELPTIFDKDNKPAASYVLGYLLVIHEVRPSYAGTYGGLRSKYYAKISTDAEEVLDLLNQQSLQKALAQLVDERVANANGRNMNLLYPICRYADDTLMRKICSQVIYWRPVIRKIFHSAIMYSPTTSAILYLDKNRLLDEYALYNHTDADTLRRSVISKFDFDKSYKKIYDMGDNSVTVTLLSDLSLELSNSETGKVLKSIPKKNSDSEKYEAVKADLSKLKKDIKRLVRNQTDDLLYAFRSGKTYPVDSWTASFIDNMIFRRIAELVVWEQDGNTFTLCDGNLITANHQTYSLGSNPISVAHPIEMKANDVKKWQIYCNSKGLKQPFAQVWEYAVNPATVTSDRYKGILIPYYRFASQERHGIKVEDYDFHNQIDITLEDCETDIERIDQHRHEILATDRFEIKSFRFMHFTRQVNHIISYFDKITVWGRVQRDDVSVAELFDRFTLAQIMELIQAAGQRYKRPCFAYELQKQQLCRFQSDG